MNEIFDINILYTQLAVFDAGLDRPYNNWSKPHLMQGFAWRGGSVSFAMLDDGPVRITARVSDGAPALPPQVVRVIRVPYRTASGFVEIGSVMATKKLKLDREPHDLCFELLPPPSDQYVAAVDLIFDQARHDDAAILRQDSILAPALPLMMQADPA